MLNKLNIERPDRLFYTSDTHVFHETVRVKCPRPYSSVGEMNAGIMEIWNDTVSDKDIVVHAGDFCFGRPELAADFVKKLHGRIYLVKGNHDHTKYISKAYATRCEMIVDLLRITVQDDTPQYVVATHYPMMVWDKGHYGSWHVHGHCHGNLKAPETTRLDVGWDVWGKPISHAELKAVLSTRKYLTSDHHA